MSDLNSIVGEIDKIMTESSKQVVFNTQDNASPKVPMEEVSETVAGVVMEEFPVGGDSHAFGLALVEASIGASEDMGLDPAEVLAGVVSFFQEALNSAATIAENYNESGSPIEEDDEEPDDEDPEDSIVTQQEDQDPYAEDFLQRLYEE